MTLGGVPESVPCAGCEPMLKLTVSPSPSEPDKAMETAVSSLVVSVCAVATGGSFTSVTVMETEAGEEELCPSEAANVKLSGPL